MSTPLERLVGGGGRMASSSSSSSSVVDDDDVVVTVPGNPGKSMQDSDMTPPTVSSGSVSSASAEDDSGGWFGDFKTLAISIKDTLPPTIGGIADFVHRSAMNVANEIAQLEAEEEYETGWSGDRDRDGGDVRLPWHVGDGGSEDPLLAERILQLSRDERTFLRPHQRDDGAAFFTPSRVRTIRRLLELDENLATTHARLSGRSDVPESVFWQNYFFHCDRVRNEHLERMQLEAYLNPKDVPTEEEFCEAMQAHDDEDVSLPPEPMSATEPFRPNETGKDTMENVVSSRERETARAVKEIVQSNLIVPNAVAANGEGDDGDEDSLVPDDSSFVPDDDASYVIASPPASMNSFVVVAARDAAAN